MADEKAALIERAAARLAPGGRLAVGDLMAASRTAVDGVKARLQHPDAEALFAEEFPWFVDETLGLFDAAGFTAVAVEQFSELSWGVAATRGLTRTARSGRECRQHGERVAAQGLQHVAALVHEHGRPVQSGQAPARR